MILYIMRHGEAEPKSNSRSDGDRMLTDAGITRSKRNLNLLKELGAGDMDTILTSPFARARQTAEIAKSVIRSKLVIVEETLEPTSSPYEFYSALSRLGKNTRLLAVTHQPFVGQLISDLLGLEDARIAMSTSSIARIDIEEGKEPSSGAGTLVWLVS